MDHPSVFISYSHDSEEHRARVRSLAHALQNNGIKVELDQFHETEILDWPAWCRESTDRTNSDYVICLCTPKFREAFEGRTQPDRGRGVLWESSLIDDELYNREGNSRFLSVLFDEQPESAIPRILRGWTFCRISQFNLEDRGFESLLRILTGQVAVVSGGIGQIPALPPMSPQSTTEPASVQGIVEFHANRSGFKPARWDELFNPGKRPRHVVMMAQSMSKAVDGRFAEALRTWCEGGTKIEMLFLAPDSSASNQLLDISRRIKLAETNALELAAKIHHSIDRLEANVINRLSDKAVPPLVRFATRDLPCSVIAVDHTMVVTLYGTEAEADKCSTFLIQGEDTDAYQAFMSEFRRIWCFHSRVSPYQDILMKYLRQDWQELGRLRNYDKVSPPRQAVLYPTSRCPVSCSYCMYCDTLNKPYEMDVARFKTLLVELLEMGVRHIELSGGGEPTCHTNFSAILGIIRDLRIRYPATKFGLLTNGALIPSLDVDELVQTFNEYIRVSRYEASLADGHRWRNSIKKLLKVTRDKGAGTKISAKYLLTDDTRDDTLAAIREDFEDRDFKRVDYYRFTSSRKYSQRFVAEDEQQIWRVLRNAGSVDCERSVSLALGNTQYLPSFLCWISPMSVVVDSKFDLFMCCNYMYDSDSRKMGSTKSTPFARVWKSSDHKRCRRAVRPSECERKEYSNCRFAELQDNVERLAFLTDR